MEKMKTFWVLFNTILAFSEAYKILVVFPIPARSHGNLGDGVVRHLLNAGHEPLHTPGDASLQYLSSTISLSKRLSQYKSIEVTYISPFVYKNPPSKLRVVDVSSVLDLMPPDIRSIKTLLNKADDYTRVEFMFYVRIAKAVITNDHVQKILNDPKEQFDVVIAEWMFSELSAGYAQVFNCPLIWSSSMEIHWMIMQLIDEPTNPAYTVDVMSQYAPPLDFFQRANELWTQINITLLKYFWLDRVQQDIYDSLFVPIIENRGRKAPTFNEARYNASMILSNAYVSTCGAESLPQSHKYIGGYHIDEEVKPLPQDLQKLMDNAKDGVVYFSMGSNFKSKDFPDEIKSDLLKMFGTLKQTVLWKFEEVLPNLPKNVHILEWAPQQAILSHPNLAVFITHGGMLSTTEAVHFGVPIIGIPIFADQFTNVDKAVNRGFAQRVDLSYTMAGELKEAIIEAVHNKRYAEKVKELSFIYHDRPVKPGQELVHWVNHVVNTRGAPHLRSPALDLPFYKRRFLDLAAVIAVLVLAVYILLKRAFAYIYSNIRSTKGKAGRKKNNN